jgi:hypothetical protein
MDLLGNGHSGSSANTVNRGGRSGFGRGRGQGGRMRNNNNPSHTGGAGRDNGGRDGAGGNNSKIQCQVCLKFRHSTDRCWHRFEEDYVPEERNTGAVMMNSYTIDNTWYTDTGATDHIMGELEKLSIHEKYNGTDQIRTANGAGMNIKHIGHSTIHTSIRNLQLHKILHVPSTQKSCLCSSPCI